MQERTGEFSASKKEGSPVWLAVAAVGSLGVILVIAILSIVRLGETNEAEGPVAPTSETVVPEKSEQLPSPPPDEPRDDGWRASLYGSECPAPCSAGSLCATTEDNTFESAFCTAGKAMCEPCKSKMTCVPGNAELELARGERWNLHLSTLQLIRKDKERRTTQPGPCEYQRDYWVCLRRERANESWTCLEVDDACRHGEKSDAFLSVSTEDLIDSGLEVEVRYAGKEGPPLLPRSRKRFERGMKRRGLCHGFTLALGETSAHNLALTFILAPSQ